MSLSRTGSSFNCGKRDQNFACVSLRIPKLLDRRVKMNRMCMTNL